MVKYDNKEPIEITPEMMEAGAEVISESGISDLLNFNFELTAKKIFEAMIKVKINHKQSGKNTAKIQDIDSEIQNNINELTTSQWLQSSLITALNRDCVDAANDAEYLAGLLRKRCKLILKAESGNGVKQLPAFDIN